MAQELSQITEPVSPDGGADEYFRTDRLKADLGARTARGGVVTIGSQGFKFAASIGATMILARLLTPADYGLVGMVAVVTGFVALFKDLGLSAATVQRETITSEQVSTLFWVNVAVSACVGACVAALAPAVAWFYGEPRLTAVTLAYSVGFLAGGLTVQHEALMKRRMQFTALAVTEVAALLASIVTTVILAWRGFGYWALVAGHLALSFVYMFGVWGVCGWRPQIPARGAGVGSLLRFGGNLTGFAVINYFARNLDNMLIGRFWGSRQLGLYAKAYQLLLLPIDQVSGPVTTVAIPALSRLNDQPERYRRAYLRILEKIALVTMPGIALMVATSDWIVRIVLGPQWTEAGRVFALLGVAALIQPVTNTTGWLFITQGRAHRMFQWALFGGAIIIASIVAGLPWGAAGVATTYAITWVTVVTPLLFYWVGREGHVRARDFYVTIAPAVCASLAVLASVFLLRRLLAPSNPLAGLAMSAPVALVAALATLFLIPAGRRALADSREVAAVVFRRGGEGLAS